METTPKIFGELKKEHGGAVGTALTSSITTCLHGPFFSFIYNTMSCFIWAWK